MEGSKNIRNDRDENTSRSPAARVAEGSQRAEFVRLFSRESSVLYAYIRTLLPNRADAEDIFQETSLVAWEKFDDFGPDSKFRSWLCQIALNKVRNLRRRKHRTAVEFSDNFLSAAVATRDTHHDALEARAKALEACIEKLRESDRDLLQRRYDSSVSIAELAQQVGKSVDAAYRALSRIRYGLFECINRALEPRGEA